MGSDPKRIIHAALFSANHWQQLSLRMIAFIILHKRHAASLLTASRMFLHHLIRQCRKHVSHLVYALLEFRAYHHLHHHIELRLQRNPHL